MSLILRTIKKILFRYWYVSWPLISLIIAFIISTQSAPVRLMPAPIKFSNQQTERFQTFADSSTDTAIPIFYATNRTPLIDTDNPTYTFIRDDVLRFGKATIAIGDNTLNWAEVKALSSYNDPAQIRPELILNAIHPQAEQALGDHNLSAETQQFFNELQQAVDRSGGSDLIIYVHGFNNPVWKGFAQAAQLHHFSERQVVVLAFSWPSAGSLLSYATDVRAARDSAPAFAELIHLISTHTTIQNIDVLAFSAGARIASNGLAQLNDKTHTEQTDTYRLGQIHYAAPDEDLDLFVNDLTRYIHLTKRVSIGANMTDSALRWAQRHQGRSRAGRPDLDELTPDQTAFLLKAAEKLNFDLIKIEPNTIPSLDPSSHSFWYENPWVSTDILVQFRWQRDPSSRGLEARLTEAGLKVWTFPDDYEKRVNQAINEAYTPTPRAVD